MQQKALLHPPPAARINAASATGTLILSKISKPNFPGCTKTNIKNKPGFTYIGNSRFSISMLKKFPQILLDSLDV